MKAKTIQSFSSIPVVQSTVYTLWCLEAVDRIARKSYCKWEPKGQLKLVVYKIPGKGDTNGGDVITLSDLLLFME